MAAQKPITATTIQSMTASSTAATMAGPAATDRTTPKMGLGSLTDSPKLSEVAKQDYWTLKLSRRLL